MTQCGTLPSVVNIRYMDIPDGNGKEPVTGDLPFHELQALLGDFIFKIELTSTGKLHCVKVSESFTTFTGYALHEVADFEHWHRLVFPDGSYCPLGILDRMMRGETETYDVRFVNRSGQHTWLNVRLRGCMDDAGESVVAVLGAVRDVTQQKSDILAVRNSEKQYRHVVDSINDGIGKVDAEGNIVYANRQLAEMLGLSIDEMVGRHWMKIFSPSAREVIIQQLTKRREGEAQVYEFETTRHDNGKKITIRVSPKPIFDERGAFAGSIALFQDISTYKQLQTDLRNSEDNYRFLVESIGEGISTVDADENFTFVNPAVCDLFGYSYSEMLTKNVRDVVPESEYENVLTQTEQRKKGNVSQYEVKYIKKGGGEGVLFLTVSPLYDTQSGEYSGALAIYRDVTEKYLAQKALKESEERLRTVTALAPIILFKIEIDRTVSFISGKGLEALELEGTAITGKNALYYFQGNEEVKVLVDRMLSEEQLSECIQLNDKWFEVKSRILNDENGEHMGTIGVAIDITDLKEREAQLERARIEAEDANRAKSEFLSNISHEVRTPMNSVLGYSQLLRAKLTEPKHLAYLDQILSSGKAMITLLGDFLDLSKMDAGRLQLHYELFDIRELIRDVVTIFEARGVEKQLSLTYEIAQDVPKMIRLDKVRLRQVLFNLLGNAIKFTNSGFVHVNVDIIRHDMPFGPVSLVIAVEDTGIGIPPQKQKQIFDAFRQQENGFTRQYQGAGLGLAICRRLLALMNGEISVSSTEGVGSVFEVVIRDLQYDKGKTASVDIKAATAKATEEYCFNRQKILVVDDEPANLEIARQWLEMWNLEVCEAANGCEALEKASIFKPDLIFMDIQMPLMNGFQAVERLKSERATSSIPVIALTASLDEKQKQTLPKRGFDHVMDKPLDRYVFLENLIRFLNR